jgi:TRAP-type uncharacterized transport system substrate-binding protein
MIRNTLLISAALAGTLALAACGSTGSTPTDAETPAKTATKTATPKPKPKSKTIATGKASGDYALATVDGTASGKTPIRLKVTTPDGVGASVNWTMACSQSGLSAGSKSGDMTIAGTKSIRLAKPSSDSHDCIVAATAQLDGSGDVRMRLVG